MKSKISKKISTKASRRYTFIFVVALLFYIILLVGFAVIMLYRIPKQTGQFILGDTFAGETLSHSLDLRVASKATYPSSPLRVVKDLGVSDGLSTNVVSFNAKADNLTEFGLLMMPASTPPAHGFPTVILCHGYANPSRYSTTSSYIEDMAFYAQHGFAVVKPDYRGQGISLHAGEPDSAYYSMAYNTDVMSLISSLKQTNFVNKDQINLWGHSMGAYIALRAAVLSPDIKNLVLLSAPVDSLSKMYLTYIPPSDENNLTALKTRQELFNKYGIPIENNAFWKNASPANYVSRIKAHVQVHTGLLDQVVPPEFSADLDAAMSKGHIKHDYYVYPDGTHSLIGNRDLIWSRSLHAFQLSNS
jgi:dipeptidyl aminopeptidase/acylaminoacyl peptidase